MCRLVWLISTSFLQQVHNYNYFQAENVFHVINYTEVMSLFSQVKFLQSIFYDYV